MTGDAFSNVPCANSGATCTNGLHTIGVGASHVQRIQYTRVEKCGQRGTLGRYCLHFHVSSRCPSCVFRGNAIEYGHQRGIVIHGTHEATVEGNVIYDVRGAGIYLEDGNEMANTVAHNVVICPWAREGPKRGCTVPGTDNAEADTVLNQAGLWALPTNNHIIGNRFANSFNGLFIQANFHGGNGRGAAEGARRATRARPLVAGAVRVPSMSLGVEMSVSAGYEERTRLMSCRTGADILGAIVGMPVLFYVMSAGALAARSLFSHAHSLSRAQARPVPL